MFAGVKIVHIRPVGHDHAVPVKPFLQPSGQEFPVCMGGDAVYAGRVHHDGKGPGLGAFLEGAEILLAHVMLRKDGGGAVFSGKGSAISHIMLDAGSHLAQADAVGVFALNRTGFSNGHHRLQVRILTVALPDSGPAGITPEVHHGRENPGAHRSPCLVCHHGSHVGGVAGVEGCRQIHFLREESALRKISGTMNHVQAVDGRNTNIFHRRFLDLGNDIGGLFPGLGRSLEYIQYGTYLPPSENTLHLCRIDIVTRGDNVDVQLHQLADLGVEIHSLQSFFDLRLKFLVGRNRRCRFWPATGTECEHCDSKMNVIYPFHII